MPWWIIAIGAAAIAIGIAAGFMGAINWALDYNDEDAGPDPVGDASLLGRHDLVVTDLIIDGTSTDRGAQEYEKAMATAQRTVDRLRYEVEPKGA